VAPGKVFENLLAVIADGRQLNTLFFESWECALQLDQLPLAERSPVGGTKKQKNRAPLSLQRIERLGVPKLVGKGKPGSLLSHRQSDGHRLQGGYANRIAI
jgi:hypothetical protein